MNQNGQIAVFPWQRELKVHTVWDLGIGKNMRVGFFQRDTVVNRVRMIDHLVGEGSEGLPEVAAKVLKKPYGYGKHFGPHDLETKDIGSGKTRMEIGRKLGIRFRVVPNLLIKDGINGTSTWLDRLNVHKESCKKWIDSMKSYRREWDDKRGMYKDEPLHDWASHDADMSRYAASVENKMNNENQILNRPFSDVTDKIWRDEPI